MGHRNTPASDGKLGLKNCVGILVGGMIGSAIFSLSGVTIAQAGPAAMLSWVLGGLVLLGYGLIASELSARYPQSGGVYVFPARAFRGKKAGFLGWISAWSCILTNIAAVAFSAIYVGTYLSVAFPFAGKLQIPLALAALALCLLANCIHFSTAGKINTAVVALLLGTMGVYICTAFFGGSYNPSLLQPFFTQGSGGTAGFLACVPTAIIAYSAVTAVAFMVSEVRKPEKTVPKAVAVSIVLVIAVYLLMLLATLGLVSAGFLAENPGMQYIPLFAACFTALGSYPWLTALVSISAVLALMTTMMVCVSMNARIIQAVASAGILPRVFSRNNKKNVPAFAAAATAVPAAVIACFPALTETIVNFGAVLNCITLAVTVLSLPAARRNQPDAAPGFTAPGGSILPWAVLAILLACNLTGIFSGSGMLWAYTGGFLALGVGIWILAERKRKK